MKPYPHAVTAVMSVFASVLVHNAYAGPSNLTASGNDGLKLKLSTALTPAAPDYPMQPSGQNAGPTSLKLARAIVHEDLSAAQPTGPSKPPVEEISPEFHALRESYYQGSYLRVAKEGMSLLEREPRNAALRLAVANSLAWTGATSAAQAQYRALLGTRYHSEALLGIGHVNRWSGRPDRAARAYREVLRQNPANDDARSSLVLADRELRPITAARLGQAGNSDDSQRTWTAISHAWRNESGDKRNELTAGRIEEDNHTIELVQRDLTWRFDDSNAQLAQAEISAQESPHTKLFAAVTLKPAETGLQFHFGRINWGKLAFNPQALQDGLSANRLGADFNYRSDLGRVRLAYNAYRISDGNLVQDASAQLTPAIQPFGTSHIRGYLGIEARKSRFHDSRYWSPEEGQYSALVGISADWSDHWWQTSGSVQYGVPLTGESGRNWSAGFGIKRWLSEDWAASVDIWAINTPRDGGYKSHSGSIRIEKLW